MAAFAGTGFGAPAKLARNSGSQRSWIRRASSHVARRAAAHSAAISPGISLLATDTTPSPPIARTASVAASSPAITATSRGRSRQITAICSMLPLASLTAITRGCSASRRNVSASTLAPVRDGTLYTTIGRPPSSAMARKWAVEHPLVGPVVVRRDDEGGVGPEGGRAAGGLDRRTRVVGPGPGDDRGRVGPTALRDGLDGDLDAPVALGGRERGRLAGGADGDEAVDAGEDLPRGQRAIGGLVDGRRGGERGDERGERAAEASGSWPWSGPPGWWSRGSCRRPRRRGREQVVDDLVERVDAGRARRRHEPAGGGERARRHRRIGRARRAAARSTRRSPSKVTRWVPGAAPARMPGDLEDRAPVDRRARTRPAAPSAGRRAAIRRASARAVPDGRSALPRRCHSTIDGSNPPAAAYQPARGLRRAGRTAPPRATGSARRPPPRRARGAAQRTSAGRRPSRSPRGRTRGCRRRAHGRGSPATARRADASTTTSTRGARPAVGRRPADEHGDGPAGRDRRRGDRAAEPARAVDRGAASSSSSAGRSRGIRRRSEESQRPRHRWCPRPLGASSPGGSAGRRSRAVRAPGPEPSGRAARASSSSRSRRGATWSAESAR